MKNVKKQAAIEDISREIVDGSSMSNAVTDSSARCFGCGAIFKNKFACIVHQRSCDEI